MAGNGIMGEILNFPTKPVRDWLLIERKLKTQLSNLQAPPTVQDRLSDKMKAFYQELDVPFNFKIDVPFPSSISKDQVRAICGGISNQISVLIEERSNALTHKLWIERLTREVDVCKELGIW